MVGENPHYASVIHVLVDYVAQHPNEWLYFENQRYRGDETETFESFRTMIDEWAGGLLTKMMRPEVMRMDFAILLGGVMMACHQNGLLPR